MENVRFDVSLQDLASSPLMRIAKHAEEVNLAFGRMKRNGEKAGGDLLSLGKSSQNAGSLLSGLTGRVGALVGGLAVLEGAKGIAKLSMDAEQTKIAFTTMLGSADKATKMIADLNKFAIDTPFEPEPVIRAGKALTAFQVKQEDVIPTLRKIGDIASGTGKDFNELVTIYGKAKIAGTLYAEDINQLVEAGVPVMGEFAKALGTTESNVKKMAEKGLLKFSHLEKAFDNLSGKGGMFFNLMDAQSKTVGGRLSSLMGNLQGLGMSIGDAVLPYLGKFIDFSDSLLKNLGVLKQAFQPFTDAISGFSTEFNKVLTDMGFFKAIGDPVQATLKALGFVITEATRPLTWLINNLKVFVPYFPMIVEAVKPAWDALSALGDQLKIIKDALFGTTISANGASLVMEFLSATISAALKPIEWMAKYFAWGFEKTIEWTGAIQKAWKESETFRTIVTAAFNAITFPIQVAYKQIMLVVDGLKKGAEWLGIIESKGDSAAQKQASLASNLQGSSPTLEKFFAGVGGTKKELEKQFLESGVGKNLMSFFTPKQAGAKPNIMGASSAVAMGAGKSDLKAGIAGVQSDAKAARNVTININKLVEQLNIQTTTVREGAQEIKRMISETLLTATNDVNLLAGA